MATKNIEALVEDYGIELAQTHSSLKGIPMRHKDEQKKSLKTVITFSAKKGADRLDGPGGCDVTLTIEYRSDNGTPQRNSLIADAIDECFSSRYIPRAATTSQARFSWLGIEDQNKNSDRPDTKNMRRFSYEIPFIAKVL